jgi:hypothetical protein
MERKTSKDINELLEENLGQVELMRNDDARQDASLEKHFPGRGGGGGGGVLVAHGKTPARKKE